MIASASTPSRHGTGRGCAARATPRISGQREIARGIGGVRRAAWSGVSSSNSVSARPSPDRARTPSNALTVSAKSIECACACAPARMPLPAENQRHVRDLALGAAVTAGRDVTVIRGDDHRDLRQVELRDGRADHPIDVCRRRAIFGADAVRVTRAIDVEHEHRHERVAIPRPSAKSPARSPRSDGARSPRRPAT